MTVTVTDVRAHLDPEEPDYASAALLGPAALPVLDELVRGDCPAAGRQSDLLASLIPGEQQPSVLAAAATTAEPTVRVAAAAGLRNLAETMRASSPTICSSTPTSAYASKRCNRWPASPRPP
jgi:hypothetical protein